MLTLKPPPSVEFGRQQVTTEHLVFLHCPDAVLVHADSVHAMHGFVFDKCHCGVSIRGVSGRRLVDSGPVSSC